MRELAEEIFQISSDKGFWDQCYHYVPTPEGEEVIFDPHLRNFGEFIALVHSELSEALEAHRTGANDDKLTDLPGHHVELADAVIRVLDYCGAHDIDIEQIIRRKLEFNRARPRKHGKAY